MNKTKESKAKVFLDNLLIYNLYILIIGAILLFISFLLSMNGNDHLYIFFQKLWYPLFIPSLSLFFTAILIEALLTRIDNTKSNN